MWTKTIIYDIMQQITICRGIDIPFEGAAERTIGSVPRPKVFHIVPDQFVGISPKMDVKEGDNVEAGAILFHDKRHEELCFTAPVSGKVLAIVRGERRKVMSIDIEGDATIRYQSFDIKNLNSVEMVRGLLLYSGLWALIKQRPYDCIALLDKTPKAIFISTFDSAPVAPDYDFVLASEGHALQTAISTLKQIAPVYVGLDANHPSGLFKSLQDCTLYSVKGPHPAGNVGVQINHVCPVNKGETVWTINIQDLALIGRLFTKGIVDMQKLVALTGPLAYDKKYYRVLPGMPVSSLLESNVHSETPCVYVAGNVLSGRKVTFDDMISLYDNQYTVLASGTDTHEFMGWLLPRFKEYHVGHTDIASFFDCKLLRWLFGKKEYVWDNRVKGGRRALIMSGEYDKVFPMDIYPEQLLRAMISGNLDKMEALGAYEVVPEDFALCEYVCTSKIPVQSVVRKALDYMKSEIE